MQYFLMFLIFATIILPLYFAMKRAKQGKSHKYAVIANICLFFLVTVVTLVVAPIISSATELQQAAEVIDNSRAIADGLGYIAAALVTGMACIGAGIAVAASASSAIGATSENSSMLAKSLIFVALAEGVALYGILISLQILSRLG